LRKSPTFTATAVSILALCIGANAAIFSLVDAVLLRPLPYPKPERLAKVITTLDRGGLKQDMTSQTGSEWEAVRDLATSIEAAAYSDIEMGVNLAVRGQVVNLPQQRVSAEFFRVLGIQPVMGRGFTREEDQPGGPPGVVLSYELWERLFEADPSVLGQEVLLKGEPYTVVGVMPRDFRTSVTAELWTPLRPATTGEGRGQNYSIIARLLPDVTWVQAESQVELAGEKAFENLRLPSDMSVKHRLVPLQRGLTLGLRQPLFLLWGAVSVVLLVGCVNIAGLLLARSAGRAHELATRMALGGGRAAILRQLLSESLLLSLFGGVAGIGLGYLGLQKLGQLLEGSYPIWQKVELDGRVFAAMFGLTLLTSLLFGAFPAFHTSRVDIRQSLLEGGSRGTATGWTRWPRRLLVVSEITLGVFLLIGAGLLVRTFTCLQNLDPGFEPTNVMTASISLQDARYMDQASVNRLFERSLTRIDELPGVESAAVTLCLPYERGLNLSFHITGEANNFDMTNLTYVTPEYFRTLGIPLFQGRLFDRRDVPNAQKVLVVNQAFAERYFSERDAMGRSISIANEPREIVGIVGNVQRKRSGWGDYGPLAPIPTVYVPATQVSDSSLQLTHTWFSPSWVVRTSGGQVDTNAEILGVINAIDPQLPVAGFRSMREVMSSSLSEQRMQATLMGSFAGLALLLAAVGIYGLIANSVVERTRELGIRLALGASFSQTAGVVAFPGIILASIGVTLGILLSRVSVLALRHLIWGVTPTDPATHVIVAVGMLLVATVASLLPALRVTRLDPAKTLRVE
jgi:predicted permease